MQTVIWFLRIKLITEQMYFERFWYEMYELSQMEKVLPEIYKAWILTKAEIYEI